MSALRMVTGGILVILLAAAASRLAGQTHAVSPVEAGGFTRLTPYDTLQTFLRQLRGPGMTVEPIGTTIQGRTISVVRVSSSARFGSDTSKLRILLFAQQHGDEPSGKEAMTMLLASLAAGGYRNVLRSCDLLIVPQMNPDGSELAQRRTADSVDLNRNHAILTTPNTLALHDLFYRWTPHLTVDIHQYGAWSEEWSDSGFIKRGDVQLGMLTNLNTTEPVRDLQHAGFFPFVSSRMHAQGYSFQEYIVGSPEDRIRHSTTEINDGRQGFGILGTVSFIQEGVKWHTPEEALERCVRSQLTAISALLEYAADHAAAVKSVVEERRAQLPQLAGTDVAVRMEHRSSGAVLDIPVRYLEPPHDGLWRVHPYHDRVYLQTRIALPSGYLIPRELVAVQALIARHHIETEEVKAPRNLKVQAATIDSAGWQVPEEDSLPRLYARWIPATYEARPGDRMVSTACLQSQLLAILLEPESMWGLPKYEMFSSLARPGAYPILRIP